MANERFTELIGRVREFIRAPRSAVLPLAAEEGAGFADLARDLFAAQYDAVAPYQALCRARGIQPDGLRDWRAIPAVPTSAFKELDFTSLAAEERRTVFHSSGTTGSARSRHFHSNESLALYETSLRAGFAPAFLPEWGPGGGGFRWVVLAPPAVEAPHSSLAHMFSTVAAAFGPGPTSFVARDDGAGGWRLEAEAALRVLDEAVKAGERVGLLGTAFGLVHLVEHLERVGVRVKLPAGSRGLETGGYKGRSRALTKAELHGELACRLGLPSSHVVCEYGMSELGSQAYDGVAGEPYPPEAGAALEGGPTQRTEVRRCFHFPPWARAWVVSPEDGREVGEGETGLLRVLDLANVRSVMAVQTEDLAVRRGAGFELLGRRPEAEARGCSLLAR